MDNRTIYKTAAELGIQQWEHDGLVALIGPLSRDERRLNMCNWHTCDTVHCIGGWVWVLSGRSMGEDLMDINYSPRVMSLYLPEGDGEWNYEDISAPHAARAIVNFLTLGEPRWDDVMRGA